METVELKIKSKEAFVLEREDIELHAESVEFLENVFIIYSEDELKESTVVESPIIHLYATKDTRNSDGDLNGYNDSLFFEAHIYDTRNKIKYVRLHHDSIDTGKADLFQVRIFKDGSTLMHFNGNYKFGFTTTLSMYLAGEQ